MNKKCVLNFAHLMDRDVNALLNPLFEWRRVTLECSQLKMSWVQTLLGIFQCITWEWLIVFHPLIYTFKLAHAVKLTERRCPERTSVIKAWASLRSKTSGPLYGLPWNVQGRSSCFITPSSCGHFPTTECSFWTEDCGVSWFTLDELCVGEYVGETKHDFDEI